MNKQVTGLIGQVIATVIDVLRYMWIGSSVVQHKLSMCKKASKYPCSRQKEYRIKINIL